MFDLAVVGAGIVGLSCALAAARRGLKVVVIERDSSARGASVRNFGLVTVSGQARDPVWQRARRSREVWLQVAAGAGIPIVQRGLWVVARRAEAATVLAAFMAADMAEGCELLSAATARRRCPELSTAGLEAVLWSPHELRVESRHAIPALAAWLARDLGVVFHWDTAVTGIEPPCIETSHGRLSATAVVACPGDAPASLFAERLAAAGMGRCRLQMLRLEGPGFTLPGTVMSDLSLIRYGGFAGLPEAQALRRCLQAEQSEYLLHGIHLIIAQGSDGSLVVGDSHHDVTAAAAAANDTAAYETPGGGPTRNARVDALLLDEFRAVTGHDAPAVRERWTGTYAVAPGGTLLLEAPQPGVRLVVATGGVGASTGFAIGEEVIEELMG